MSLREVPFLESKVASLEAVLSQLSEESMIDR